MERAWTCLEGQKMPIPARGGAACDRKTHIRYRTTPPPPQKTGSSCPLLTLPLAPARKKRGAPRPFGLDAEIEHDPRRLSGRPSREFIIIINKRPSASSSSPAAAWWSNYAGDGDGRRNRLVSGSVGLLSCAESFHWCHISRHIEDVWLLFPEFYSAV